jgi:hypothetical protein
MYRCVTVIELWPAIEASANTFPPAFSPSQTIGQRFEGYDDEALLEEISDDEIDVYKLKCPGDAGLHGVDSGNVEMLATYLRQVIEECKDQPWEATHTACARLMDRTIKLMRRARNEYPRGWFFVMNLRVRVQLFGATMQVQVGREDRAGDGRQGRPAMLTQNSSTTSWMAKSAGVSTSGRRTASTRLYAAS